MCTQVYINTCLVTTYNVFHVGRTNSASSVKDNDIITTRRATSAGQKNSQVA